MELLFLVVAASLSAASLVLWSRARREQEGAPRALPTSSERTPLTLQVGDIVTHLDRDYLVEGALLLSESPRAARLCRLIDGAEERFLYATTQDAEEAWLLRDVEPLFEGRPERAQHGGEPLRLERRWHAAALSAGRLGRRSFDAELDVHEYAGTGGRLVLLLDGPQRSGAYLGERLLPHAIEILPGRGA